MSTKWGRAENVGLSMGDVTARFGLTADTLRYYEKVGLITAVDRTTGNQRRYAASDLAWIEFLLRLRDTGLPICDMRKFAELRAAGDTTIAERLTLLLDHRQALERRIADLRRNAAAIDAKVDYYRTVLAYGSSNDD